MIDLHTHLLPGLDDGASTTAEALEMGRMMVADGVDTVVASPHMGDALFDCSRADILAGVEALQTELDAAGIPLKVVPGGDVHLETATLDNLRRGEVMTIADGRRAMLLELPNDLIPPGIEEILFEIQLEGVVPIITHPERIREVQESPEVLVPLIVGGALIQVTAGALHPGHNSKRGSGRCARVLLKNKMVHVVASDAHSPGHFRPPGLTRARQEVADLVGAEMAEMIFETTPRTILDGGVVNVPDPENPRKRSKWLPWL